MEKFKFNNKALRSRRKDLRVRATKSEDKLWIFLKNRGLDGLKFFRQFSIGGYILDFYCPKSKLGVEIDGSIHETKENMDYDKDREGVLQSSNIRIIRFWNNEVLNNIELVLEKIKKEAKLS